MGVDFRIFHELSKGFYDADSVIIENRIYREWGVESQDNIMYEVLRELDGRVENVIWFDTTDSTGTTQFQFLPYVKAYYKSQLLVDKSLYTKTHYGSRIYTGYYHDHFGVVDNPESVTTPARKDLLGKIRLGWNHSLGDFGYWGKYSRLLRMYLGFAPLFYSTRFALNSVRTQDVSARFGTSYARNTISFQRNEVKCALASRQIVTEKIPKHLYLKELAKSKIAISPFGWGEPSFRDYEIFIQGSALVKPDMSHLRTWPALYHPHKTYLPFKWDCSDIEQVIEEALENNHWKGIGKNGQDTYQDYIYGSDKREEFCKLVLNMTHNIVDDLSNIPS